MRLLNALFWRILMLPTKGCNPEFNVLYIGGFILKKIHERKNKKMPIVQIFKVVTRELSVSVDHIILALDWLYIISAIDCNGKEAFINEIA